MSLHVDIVTPSRKVFEGQAERVELPGWLGEIGALSRHASLLTLVRAGVVTLHGATGQLMVEKEATPLSGDRRLVVGAGFAEVGADRVTLVVDLCEDSAGVDKGAAQAALVAAEKVLASEDSNSVPARLAVKQADLARARLKA